MASVSNNPVDAGSENQPTIEERRALIERVAASEQFSRAARLRDFLLYVGKQSLKPGCPDIHEQEIGEKVFGRSASYDRGSDNIVRVNATELRKRIDTYFASVGAQEMLIFEIPRGGYKPVFHRRLRSPEPAEIPSVQLEPPEISVPAAIPLQDAREGKSRGSRQWIWPVACILLALVCIGLIVQNRSMQNGAGPWAGKPALAAFWGGFLNPHKETDLVLPDDSASLIEDLTGSPISLDDYQDREFIRRFENSTAMSSDRKQDVDQVFNHNLVTFGAVRAAQLILKLIPSSYPNYLTHARYFTADDINRKNVVLIGGQKAVPWDYLFDSQLNFVTDYDYTQGVQLVRNHHPKPGEEAIYKVIAEPNSTTGYATIAYVSNPSQTGSVIILAGTDSDATGAAAAFLTSEEQMEKFRKTLHADSFPYFEVLLKTSRLSGAFFEATPIAYREYPRSQ